MVRVLCSAFAISAILCCADTQACAPPSQQDLDKKIRELQQQRVAVLTEAAKHASAMFKQGTTSWDVVAKAQQELLVAQLELAETVDEKVTIMQSQIEWAKQLVKFVEARYDAGACSILDLHRAKATVLRAEIDLLRLRKSEKNR